MRQNKFPFQPFWSALSFLLHLYTPWDIAHPHHIQSKLKLNLLCRRPHCRIPRSFWHMKLRTSYRWFSFLTINAERVSSGSFRDHNKIHKIESVLQLCVLRNCTLSHVRTCASNKELEPWVMILERNQNSLIIVVADWNVKLIFSFIFCTNSLFLRTLLKFFLPAGSSKPNPKETNN